MCSLYLRALQLTIFIWMRCEAQEFPSGFKFGAATAAYQVEGAWNLHDKGESIWDRYVHTLGTTDNTTGDVAGDSFHLWREDVRLISQLGLDFYRFSISWTRILPTGLPNSISKDGVKYYSNLIDELLRQGIEPVVTLYHFDLPIKLQDLGGWTNPLITSWFEDYARVIFSLYADRVKTWITINEPIVICDLAYNTGVWAPGIIDKELAPFICNKNVIMAHAKAYRLYEREYKKVYAGRMSLANNVLWIEPYNTSKSAQHLAELGLEHMVGRYSHPIYSDVGGWPKLIEQQMLKYSLQQGYRESKLPFFTEEEKSFVRGTADFYALNYYTGRVIRPAHGAKTGPWFTEGSAEIDAIMETPHDAKPSSSSIIPSYPIGLRKMLSYIKNKYGNIEMLITENGYAGNKEINDYNRVEFIKEHLEQVLLSIREDEVNVIGYTYWSLFDAFEWGSGYSLTFGLYDLDIRTPRRLRTPRLSAQYYACVIETKSINISEKCTHKIIVNSSYTHQLNISLFIIYFWILK